MLTMKMFSAALHALDAKLPVTKIKLNGTCTVLVLFVSSPPRVTDRRFLFVLNVHTNLYLTHPEVKLIFPKNTYFGVKKCNVNLKLLQFPGAGIRIQQTVTCFSAFLAHHGGVPPEFCRLGFEEVFFLTSSSWIFALNSQVSKWSEKKLPTKSVEVTSRHHVAPSISLHNFPYQETFFSTPWLLLLSILCAFRKSSRI